MTALRNLLREDMETWATFYKKPIKNSTFWYLFMKYPEYRVLVKTRMKAFETGCMGGVIFAFRCIVAMTCTTHNLFVYTLPEKVGRRLIFHHGFASMISASSIGNDCHIFQQVTIGNGKGGTPVIGNNVVIYSGAKVIGNITIGDDVIIGANAVVNKDVPPHSVVAGIPAKVIKRRNSRSDVWENL